MVKIYSLYRGEENLCDGTLEEIAELMQMKVKSLKYFGYPAYCKRTNEATSFRLVYIGEE
ncbi:hypothetical protein BG261_02945 [Floricoccus tropicus]|uniref:Uncharacterized protein n=1 Tax=Floricoccus tropicus TaxID=1859473 RepID=A0A1E8GMU0_9LACT|nr:hypothetical protein [Floricoccus tropicus]OFI49552.1 hypothetical protein BG261_02945 [Floricoccus tropicus]